MANKAPVKHTRGSRREKITKAGSTVFITVAIAAVVVMFSIVSIRFLWNQKRYNDRVITAKTEARDAINSNIENLEALSEQFADLKEGNPSAETILHALPPNYDYAALATSINFLTRNAGVSFQGSIGQDESAAAIKSAHVSTPVEIPVVIEVTGSYNEVSSFIEDLENSIRPFHILGVDYSGTNSNLTANINTVTYYQPVRSLDVVKEELK